MAEVDTYSTKATEMLRGNEKIYSFADAKRSLA